MAPADEAAERSVAIEKIKSLVDNNKVRLFVKHSKLFACANSLPQQSMSFLRLWTGTANEEQVLHTAFVSRNYYYERRQASKSWKEGSGRHS